VKRSGKLITKGLSKASSSSPISAPPKAAVSASKVKKDDVQRRENSFQETLRGTSRERGEGSNTLNQAANGVSVTPGNRVYGKRSSPTTAGKAVDQANNRVTELERALSAVKEEQLTLREELDKVRQQTQAFVEKPEHHTVKAEHHLQYMPSSTMMQHQRDSESYGSEYLPQHQINAEELYSENHELRYRYAQLQDRLAAQETPRHNKMNEPTTHDGTNHYNDLRLRLHATEKESQERLQQLLSLKSRISSLTRIEAQVTDSEFAESFMQLANRVREWVVSNYRRSKLGFHNASPETLRIVRLICPAYERINSTDRLALYQAVVSNALMQILQEPVIVGIPTAGPLAAIRSFAEGIQDAEVEYYAWRRATIRAIDSSNAKHTLGHERDRSLHRLAGEIGEMLFSLTSVDLTGGGQSVLFSILNTAADLQRTLSLQTAQYRVVSYQSSADTEVQFDEQRMESINDLDRTEREFIFCVFPCLEKSDVEENPGVGIVIFKARVCCGAE
jgi:hypothetical protein